MTWDWRFTPELSIFRADMKKRPTTFGARVKAARDRLGWTQERLATEAGMQQAAISKLERGGGRRLPTVTTLTAIAGALGVTTDYLLGRVEPDAEELVQRIERVKTDLDRVSAAVWSKGK